MDARPTAAAHITNRRLDMLATNAIATALYAPLMEPPVNMVTSVFLKPASRTLFLDWPTRARDVVAALRLGVGHEPEIMTFAAEMCDRSEEFAALWRGNDVRFMPTRSRLFYHPDVGTVTLTYQSLMCRTRPVSTCSSAVPNQAVRTRAPSNN